MLAGRCPLRGGRLGGPRSSVVGPAGASAALGLPAVFEDVAPLPAQPCVLPPSAAQGTSGGHRSPPGGERLRAQGERVNSRHRCERGQVDL